VLSVFRLFVRRFIRLYQTALLGRNSVKRHPISWRPEREAISTWNRSFTGIISVKPEFSQIDVW
jgi:hypothetical protein